MTTHLPAALRGPGVLLGMLASLVMPAGRVAHPHDCFARPSGCGYPDATNTGVPPGTTLERSGPLTVSEDGATLGGLESAAG